MNGFVETSVVATVLLEKLIVLELLVGNAPTRAASKAIRRTKKDHEFMMMSRKVRYPGMTRRTG
jgi:hypothetical protein